VREARLGLSHARNAAAKAARGDVLLWTDDDVLVEPGWVEGYVRACTDFPDAGFYGGPVDPWFEGEPPGWLRECFRSLGQAYAIRDLPPGTTDLSRGSLPYGANFATRTELHSRLSFDPDLGRVGRRGGCLSEESSFLQRALDLGYSGRWVPESRVAHLIPRERQTLRYLREYFVIAGSTPTNPGLGGPTLLGRPRWLWRSLVENELKFWATRWLTGPGTWMPYLRDAAIARGALRRKG
jgi:glycosyltransferase involved in cell wall biosynthesis